MNKLLKQRHQLKSQIRRAKKTIRNAQDSKKKSAIVLEKIGREVSRFYAINKNEVDRTVYMVKTEIAIKKQQKTLVKAEKILKIETPKLALLKNELLALEVTLNQFELEETKITKTISLKNNYFRSISHHQRGILELHS